MSCLIFCDAHSSLDDSLTVRSTVNTMLIPVSGKSTIWKNQL